MNDLRYQVVQQFLREGTLTHRQEWQGLKDESRPQMKMMEVQDVSMDINCPISVEELQASLEPNLPWAEDHFQERISGKPLNPGEQYKNWPWYQGGVEEHKETGQFSHTYMERYWPREAGDVPYPHGIRYTYGDLDTLMQLLDERPMTRQAYLPIWFPEDLTAAVDGQRVPCSLGYLFQVRSDASALDMWYYMRSCDFNRYLADDLYLSGRLLQYVAQGMEAMPGTIHANIANLHIFAEEAPGLVKEFETERRRRMLLAL